MFQGGEKSISLYFGHIQTAVFVGAQRPSWMNEWVGQDINVVGPLEIPPSDEFSITDNSHFFGKSSAGSELMTSITMTDSVEQLCGI